MSVLDESGPSWVTPRERIEREERELAERRRVAGDVVRALQDKQVAEPVPISERLDALAAAVTRIEVLLTHLVVRLEPPAKPAKPPVKRAKARRM